MSSTDPSPHPQAVEPPAGRTETRRRVFRLRWLLLSLFVMLVLTGALLIEARARRWERIVDKIGIVNLNKLEFEETQLSDALQSLGLSRLSFGFRSITRIAVTGEDVGDQWLADVCRQGNLREFTAEKTNFSAAGLACLATQDQLEILGIGQEVSEAHLRQIGRLHSLEMLILQGKGVDDVGFRHLDKLENLTFLSLMHTDVRGSGLASLPAPHLLSHVILEETPIDDAGAKVLAKFTGLRILDINQAPISDAGLAHLRFSSLEFLTLTHTNVTGSCFAPPHSFRGILRLESVGSPIDDAGLKHIAKLPKLYKLELIDSDVTPDGLTALWECRLLNELRVSGKLITFESVHSLAEVKSLEVLRVENKFEAGAIQTLTQLRPNLLIMTHNQPDSID